MVVSHDRHFLNEVCTDIVHFYRQKLMTYRGDVSNFEAVREEEKQKQIRLFENQEKQKVSEEISCLLYMYFVLRLQVT